jgi:hypothetical protein
LKVRVLHGPSESPAPASDHPETPEEPEATPGHGGAREPDRPPASIDEQIAEAEAAGNFREATSLKSWKLASAPKPA